MSLLHAPVTPSTRMRLIEQYHRVVADSGRYERVERNRFLAHLLDTVREHSALATTGLCSDSLEPWQLEFLRSRAARAGVDTSVAFGFIIHELGSRVGVRELRADLTAHGGRLGTGIAKRLGAPAAIRFARLAVLRVVSADTSPADHVLQGAQFESEEHARIDLRAPAVGGHEWLRGLRVAVAVDNRSPHTLHAIGIEAKIQVQTRASGRLVRTGLSSMGVICELSAARRGWVAFRGVDFGPELLREVGPADPIVAIRFLIARK